MVKSASSLLLCNRYATLKKDLNTMKGTVVSKLKKIAQPFKTVQFLSWKIAPSSLSLKKNPENCYETP